MIIIPMAGLSSRFKKAGYKLPKYMLEAKGKSLFEHSVESFRNYFSSESFLFITLDVFESKKFIEQKCKKLGVKNYSVLVLNNPTKGQAETVYLGLKELNVDNDEHLLIYNIDTFRPNFIWPTEFDVSSVDGYLETFVGSGSNWSNVLPLDEIKQTVKLTAEKQEISKYCCTGLYYWRRASDFRSSFNKYKHKSLSELDGGEYYIAPMFNDLIDQEKDIRYSVISRKSVIFCGVPSEYEEFLK